MRVSDNMGYQSTRDSIQRSKERMDNLQQQSATMRKLNTPSDDPVGAAKILELRTDHVNNNQYQMNAKLAEAFLNNTDHALSDMSEIVVRAKEIAINQASAPSSSEDSRRGVAEEVTQLFNQAVGAANTRIGERYIFGGFKTQTPPVSPDGDYLGDSGQMMVEIANNVFISMNVPGLEAFNTHPKSQTNPLDPYANPYGQRNDSEEGLENVNLFDELQDFRIALVTGDMELVRSTLERFDQMNAKLVAMRSKVGSRIQGIQSTNQAIERHNLTNAALSSGIEDADMAQVVSDLGKEETVFRSSLMSSKRLIQPTLLDFLK